jgi:hypothetical protein
MLLQHPQTTGGFGSKWLFDFFKKLRTMIFRSELVLSLIFLRIAITNLKNHPDNHKHLLYVLAFDNSPTLLATHIHSK